MIALIFIGDCTDLTLQPFNITTITLYLYNMQKLVLIRHGESIWNKENRFTGWTDVDLSENGYQQAKNAGQLLKKYGYTFDTGFCSVLKRSIKTLDILLEEMDLLWIPVQKSWRLNERFYGALQGLNKDEIVTQYGEEQVHKWRRDHRRSLKRMNGIRDMTRVISFLRIENCR